MHTALYIAVHLIILTIVWRWVYMSQLIHAYKEKCHTTCKLLKKNEAFAQEVAETWPMRSIMFDITHWGLERYIVNQDLYNEMLDELTDEAMKILTKAFKIAAEKDDGPTADAAQKLLDSPPKDETTNREDDK